jgi:hypothetical protein
MPALSANCGKPQARQPCSDKYGFALLNYISNRRNKHTDEMSSILAIVLFMRTMWKTTVVAVNALPENGRQNKMNSYNTGTL